MARHLTPRPAPAMRSISVLLAPALLAGTVVAGGAQLPEPAPLRLVAASGPDLVPLVLTDGPALTGRPAGSTIVVVNSGDAPAVARVELDVDAVGGTATTYDGTGWECDDSTGRCAADVELAPDERSEPLVVTQQLAPADVSGPSLFAQLSTALPQPTTNDNAGSSRSPVADSDVDLAVIARPRGVVRSGDDGVFDVIVHGAGPVTRDGGVTVYVRETGLLLGRVTASGAGWVCEQARDSQACSFLTSPAEGESLPTLEVRRSGPENDASADRPPVGIAAVLETVDAFEHNDVGIATAPVVPRTAGDLVVAASADPAGGFAVDVAEAGEGTDGPVEVRLEEVFGRVTAAGGTGWACVGDAMRTCRHPGPVQAGTSLPTLRAATSFGRLEASLIDPSTPGAPEVVRAEVRPARSGPTVAVQSARSGAPGGTVTADIAVRGVTGPVTLGVSASDPTGAPQTTAAGSGWSCNGRVCQHAGGTADLPLLRLTYVIPVRDVKPVTFSGEILDSPANPVPTGAAGQASASHARGAVDLVILARAGDPAAFGEGARGSVDVINAGRTTSSGQTIVDLEASAFFQSLSGSGWSCVRDGGTDRCTTSAVAAPGAALPPLALTTPARPGGGGVATGILRLKGPGVTRANGSFARAANALASLRYSAYSLVQPSGPLESNGVTRNTVSVRNDGAEPAAGPVTISVDSPRGMGQRTGEGWDCSFGQTCTHPGPIPARGALPDVQVTNTLPADEPLGRATLMSRLYIRATPEGAEEDRTQAFLPVVAGSGIPLPPPPPPAAPMARSIDDGCPREKVPPHGFTDVAPGSTHDRAIGCLLWWEVASGRGPGRYAPSEPVTRDAMAAFIARAILKAAPGSLSDAPPEAFVDDELSVHEKAINQLAEAGVISGTGLLQFSPSRVVDRGQMARFLANAVQEVTGSPLPAGEDLFSDDDGSPFELDINRVAGAGLTGGRPDGTYDARGQVARDQMGSFLARLLDLYVDGGASLPDA